ncbi:Ribosome-recycling factor [Chlamydiales bacterium SCGC AG-110-P3]|nr:Ribosome-recycling factor [Chlamydiales bacterium SCGC AG-110-P3]
MTVAKDTEEKMAHAIEHLREELKNIRTGRANPASVEGVSVEVYGTQMRLKDIANISVPEPRQLLITPFDGSNASAIGKSLEAANLGMQPIVDGNAVRLNVPQMDESVRNDMVKLSHKKREDSKINIRNCRRDANEHVRKQKADGELPEDQMKRLEKEIQELTDKYCKMADEVCAEKEKEITTV